MTDRQRNAEHARVLRLAAYWRRDARVPLFRDASLARARFCLVVATALRLRKPVPPNPFNPLD